MHFQILIQIMTMHLLIRCVYINIVEIISILKYLQEALKF